MFRGEDGSWVWVGKEGARKGRVGSGVVPVLYFGFRFEFEFEFGN